MDNSLVCGVGPRKNPFGSYEAYGCLKPGRAQAGLRTRKRARMLLLVAYALISASLLSSPAHAAFLSAAG
jgi:hypothetical protein